jgi:hypothetical protein
MSLAFFYSVEKVSGPQKKTSLSVSGSACASTGDNWRWGTVDAKVGV